VRQRALLQPVIGEPGPASPLLRRQVTGGCGSMRGFRGHTPVVGQVRGGEGARRGARSYKLVDRWAGEAGQAFSGFERAHGPFRNCSD
jgi:hypothetical protein